MIRSILLCQAGVLLLVLVPIWNPFATSRLEELRPHIRPEGTFLELEAVTKERDLPFRDENCPYAFCRVVPLDRPMEGYRLHLHFDSDGRLGHAIVMSPTGEKVDELPVRDAK